MLAGRVEACAQASSGPCFQPAWLLPHRPRKNPLFIVDLVLDSSGVHYSTPLEQFETSLINLFDKGILATHAVPQLEKVQPEAQGTCCPGCQWLPELQGAPPSIRTVQRCPGPPTWLQCAQPFTS